MVSLDLDQSIIQAEAAATAGDWGNASAGLSVDVQAGGEIKRGADLALGGTAMAAIEAGFAKFVAADATASGQASARLRGQIQAPLDLFSEAGMAVRLQAVAEASVLVRAAIGLSVGDFLDLAKQDEQLRGVPLEVLTIFLDEVDVQGGVMVKAAVSAMAYVNLAISGRLVPQDGLPSGFTITGEMGVGLEGGVGYQVFANIGLKDTGRMVRRTVDVMVDASFDELLPHMPDAHARELLQHLRPVIKIALRTGFESGLALGEATPTLAATGTELAGTGTELAERCVQVALEEVQRFLLDSLVTLGTAMLRRALADLGVDDAAWEAAEQEREHLAELLRAIPEDPFELTEANGTYWRDVIAAGLGAAVALGAGDDDPGWVEPLAILWASAQLLFSVVERVASAEARVEFLGVIGAGASTAAFTGALASSDAPPPGPIRDHINDRLGRDGGSLTQDHLIDFLVGDVMIGTLVEEVPAVAPIVELLVGPSPDSMTAAVKAVLKHASTFSDDDGAPNPQAMLEALTSGMQAYLEDRIEGELRTILVELAEDDPVLTTVIDEVLIDTLRFTVGAVFAKVLSYGSGQITGRAALRDACSSVCMKLFGRSLVVTADVLTTAAMEEIAGQFTLFGAAAGAPGGVADLLHEALPPAIALERAEVVALVEFAMDLGAQVFTPLTDAQRRDIRRLLYTAIDTVPSDADTEWIDQLFNDAVIPVATAVALTELATTLGGVLGERMMLLLNRLLTKLAEFALAIWNELVAAGAEALSIWIGEVHATVLALYDWLASVPTKLLEIGQEIGEAADAALAELEETFALLDTPTSRTALRQDLMQQLDDATMAALSPNWVYQQIPTLGGLRDDVAEQAVGLGTDLIGAAIVDPVLAAMAPAAPFGLAVLAELRELLADLAGISSAEQLTSQVAAIVLDRVEDLVRAAFGGENPGIDINLKFSIPLLGTVDIQRVELDLDLVAAAARAAIEALAAFEEQVGSLMECVGDILAGEAQEADLLAQEVNEKRRHEELEALLADSMSTDMDVLVLSPVPGAEYGGNQAPELEVFLENVPLSFLGLAEAVPPRVTILINDQPIDLAKATVEELAGAGGGATGTSSASAGGSVLDIRLAHAVHGMTLLQGTEGAAATIATAGPVAAAVAAGNPTSTDRTIRYRPGDSVGMFGLAPAAAGATLDGRRFADDAVYGTAGTSGLGSSLSGSLTSRIPADDTHTPMEIGSTAGNGAARSNGDHSTPIGGRFIAAATTTGSPGSGTARTSGGTGSVNAARYEGLIEALGSGSRIRQGAWRTTATSAVIDHARAVYEGRPHLGGRAATGVADRLGRNQREAVIDQLGTGLLLRMPLSGAVLVDGINTLAVGIGSQVPQTDGGTKPFQVAETMSFVVSGQVASLPGFPDRRYDRFPHDLAEVLRRDDRLDPRRPIPWVDPMATDGTPAVAVATLPERVARATELVRAYRDAIADSIPVLVSSNTTVLDTLPSRSGPATTGETIRGLRANPTVNAPQGRSPDPSAGIRTGQLTTERMGR